MNPNESLDRELSALRREHPNRSDYVYALREKSVEEDSKTIKSLMRLSGSAFVLLAGLGLNGIVSPLENAAPMVPYLSEIFPDDLRTPTHIASIIAMIAGGANAYREFFVMRYHQYKRSEIIKEIIRTEYPSYRYFQSFNY